MTQEELAQTLYVSRTAVSKWESGRGYPSIDSLKELSSFFQVSIDDLLSGEVLISIAEKDHKAKLARIYGLLSAVIDISALLLILLPLYPASIGGQVYSVNLIEYAGIDKRFLFIYWIMYAALIITGLLKLFLLKCRPEKTPQAISWFSVSLGIAALILMALFREAYASVLLVIMLVAKMSILICRKN
jgi:transcriptional regulator with XRE-family HTH domain